MVSDYKLLKGKTAVITGCNRGIGKAILERFAATGADVFACARKEETGFTKIIRRFSAKYSVNIIPVYFDARNMDEMKGAVKTIRDSKKSVDVLVNNAGIGYGALFQMSTQDKLKEVFEVNFYSPFIFTQYLIRLMVRQKSGNIINISSTAGIDGIRGKSVYGASKAALINMTKVIAAELADSGIRANCIAPGLTETDMISLLPVEVISGNIHSGVSPVILKPLVIADAAVFLASDLSSAISGQVIRVDGGMQ